MRKFWSEEDVTLLKTHYKDKGAAFCASSLNRTNRAVRDKARKLGIQSNRSRLAKNRELQKGEYSNTLKNSPYTALEPYINNKTKILHRHICGYEWLVTPDVIKSIKNCPVCSLSRDFQDSYLYVVYFNTLSLFKIGITNNWQRRSNEFGETPTLISSEKMNSREEALEVEAFLLDKVEDFKYNSGLLLSGNTETFYGLTNKPKRHY